MLFFQAEYSCSREHTRELGTAHCQTKTYTYLKKSNFVFGIRHVGTISYCANALDQKSKFTRILKKLNFVLSDTYDLCMLANIKIYPCLESAATSTRHNRHHLFHLLSSSSPSFVLNWVRGDYHPC